MIVQRLVLLCPILGQRLTFVSWVLFLYKKCFLMEILSTIFSLFFYSPHCLSSLQVGLLCTFCIWITPDWKSLGYFQAVNRDAQQPNIIYNPVLFIENRFGYRNGLFKAVVLSCVVSMCNSYKLIKSYIGKKNERLWVESSILI